MHFRFRHLVGAFFLFYALAFTARSDVGAIAAAAALYHTSSLALIALFACFGALLLLLHVHPPMVALLSLPIVLLGIASAVRASNDLSIDWSGAVAHSFTMAMILRWTWRQSKAGTDD